MSTYENLTKFLNFYLFLFSISSFFGGYNFAWTCFSVIFPVQIIDVVGEDQKELYLSLIPILGSICHIIATPIFGHLSDRYDHPFGRRRIWILIFVPFTCVVFFLHSFFIYKSSYGIWCIMILNIIVQITMAGASGPFGGLLPDLVEQKDQGTANGIQGLFLTIGTFFGAIGTGLIMQFLSTPSKYWMSYIYLVFGLLMFSNITVFGVTESPKESEYQNPLLIFYFPCKKYFNFYLMIGGSLTFFLSINSILPFIQYFLRDVYKFENYIVVTSVLYGIIIGIASISTIIGGIITDKIGPKPVLYFSCIIMILSFMFETLLLVFKVKHIIVLIIVFSFLGFGFGSFISSSLTLVIDILPKETIAKDLALQNQIVNVGQIFGPLISGTIIHYFKDISYDFAYTLLLTISTIFLIITFLFIIPIKTNLEGSLRKKKDIQ